MKLRYWVYLNFAVLTAVGWFGSGLNLVAAVWAAGFASGIAVLICGITDPDGTLSRW